MPEPNNSADRRGFIKSGMMAAIGSAAARSVASAAESESQQLPTRDFGKTGRKLPVLAYGGAALPKMWGNPLSTDDRVELVRYAYDRGMRYFDTAGNYMESQKIIGRALKDVRKNAYYVTKVETTDPGEVRASVERSLDEMQTDFLDAILIHGTPGIEQMTVGRAMQIHTELANLRDEGITESIGLSAHGYFDKALKLISSGGFDLCMLSCGYIPRGYDQVHSARMIELRNACIAKAHDLGMGIAAMKVIGAGLLGAWSKYIVPGFDEERLEGLPGAAIRFVLDDERIHLLVIGMRLKSEIDDNLKTFLADTTYTIADRALLTEFSAGAYESDAIKEMRIE